IYATRAVERLGWYEPVPEPSLRLLAACHLGPNDPLLDVGVGASTFIDQLLAAGFRRVIAADISAVALQRLRERLGPKKAARVQWIVDDVTAPLELCRLREVALWHDRAVFHFFTAEPQRRAYRDTLNAVLRPGGYVILAAFALGGANRCSGLDVSNYDAPLLANFLGREYALLESFDYTYLMPAGDLRPYVYTLFQRRIAGWANGPVKRQLDVHT
ncbi:MAG TPA: class I SAM-dependent methyltransferase, partial [Candidatus Binatia bacterium]|nr:class I SAM-dependent methyltransferase [Candidatus Binatia bacterium]